MGPKKVFANCLLIIFVHFSFEEFSGFPHPALKFLSKLSASTRPQLFFFLVTNYIFNTVYGLFDDTELKILSNYICPCFQYNIHLQLLFIELHDVYGKTCGSMRFDKYMPHVTTSANQMWKTSLL